MNHVYSGYHKIKLTQKVIKKFEDGPAKVRKKLTKGQASIKNVELRKFAEEHTEIGRNLELAI